jgi:hypothetical protein
MDRLLKRIQRVRSAFCSQDFFFSRDNVPAHKAASVCQFLIPKKCYNPLSSTYSPDLSPPDYFLLPKLKMTLKGLRFADIAAIQEVATNELRKVQKEKFSQLSRNCTTAQKPVYMPIELILKNMSSSYVWFFLKKISPKTFGPHCVFTAASNRTIDMSIVRYCTRHK